MFKFIADEYTKLVYYQNYIIVNLLCNGDSVISGSFFHANVKKGLSHMNDRLVVYADNKTIFWSPKCYFILIIGIRYRSD